MARDTKLWFVKIRMAEDNTLYIAYGSNRDLLSVYEVILGSSAHRKTAMNWPSMLKFIYPISIKSMTNPVKKDRAWIEKKYGKSFREDQPIPKSALER